MSSRVHVRYGLRAGGIALCTAVALVAAASRYGHRAVAWSLLGWALMAVIGVCGGVWLAREHGRPGTGFLAAMGTCMLVRLLATAAGAGAAAWSGMAAVWPYLAGLAAGFLPLQIFEVHWFLRGPGRAV